jgi:hypothetical protein
MAETSLERFIKRTTTKVIVKLLEIYKTYEGTMASGPITQRLNSNYGNIQNVLRYGLNKDNKHLASIIYSVCAFDSYSARTGHGRLPLISHIPTAVPRLCDPRLEVHLSTKLLVRHLDYPVVNGRELIEQTLHHFTQFDDPDIKCKLVCYS